MGHARLRLGRRSLDGQVYLVTFATAGRHAHFGDWPMAAAACRILTATSQWQRSRLLAWVLMPDHWHGLVELGGFDSLPACVGRVKGRSARLLRQAHPAMDAARYVVMNPVRAGLVRRIGDYPFWDAVWL